MPTWFDIVRTMNDFRVDIKYSSPLVKVPFNLIFSHLENLARYLIKLKSIFKPDLILSQYHAYHFASVVGGYISKILKIPHIIRSHDIFFITEESSFSKRVFHLLSYPKILHASES